MPWQDREIWWSEYCQTWDLYVYWTTELKINRLRCCPGRGVWVVGVGSVKKENLMNICVIRDSAVGRRTIRDVLFWFLCLSCLSNHMTSPRPASALWSQEDMGSGLRGVSWDRTCSLVLCKGEDPCLGLFVFPALSSIPTLPYPPNAVTTSPALIALPANLCVWSVLSPAHKHNSLMLPIHLLTRAWPLTPEHHSATDGETLCYGRLTA